MENVLSQNAQNHIASFEQGNQQTSRNMVVGTRERRMSGRGRNVLKKTPMGRPTPEAMEKSMGRPVPQSGSMTSASTSDDASRDGDDKLTAPATNPTQLFNLLKNQKWKEAAKIAAEHSNQARTWIFEEDEDGTLSWELLPLHHACEGRPTADVIDALMGAYPEAALIKDSGGDLPIHLACREKASPEVILMLLDSHAETSMMTDEEGRLPLHLAVQKGASLNVVQRLLIAHARASKEEDSYGLLPLHWACATDASVEIVEALLRANPYAVDHVDSWHRTPTSLVEESSNSDRTSILAALARPAHYWTQSLLDEITYLKQDLAASEEEATRQREESAALEAGLAAAAGTSSAESEAFRLLRSELESKNRELKATIRGLQKANTAADKKIKRLSEEVTEKDARNARVMAQFDELKEIISSMETQRLDVLSVAEEWDDALLKSSEFTME